MRLHMVAPLLYLFFIFIICFLCFVKTVLTHDGFCSAPSSILETDSNSQPLYWKVTNPTLSPSHLWIDQKILSVESPGFTRSVYKKDHAFITPESQVFSPLLDWTNTLGAYLITPAMGSHFVMYLAKMFIFVVQGSAVLTNISGNVHKLTIFELRKLLPTSLAYDFNVHIMDFRPGEFLNVKEVHYNQHGLLLEEQGIYRLADSWYPIQAGNAIWMAPFVPQWYAALGKTRSRYLIYKDVNRNPL
ncbi:unnamed protein product [Withania somnifera]